MPKKLAAVLLCAVMLLALVALFVFVSTGNFARLVDGEPLDWEALREAARPKQAWRLAAVGVLLVVIWDAYTLLGRRFENVGPGGSPAENPLGYAGFLFRRYMLVPVVLACLAVLGRHEADPLTTWAVPAYGVAFALARRPLNMTYGNVWSELLGMVAAFCRGFAGNR